MKIIKFTLLILIIVAVGFYFIEYKNDSLTAKAFTNKLFCTEGEDQFAKLANNTDKINVLNEDGTIRYFYDDFSSYKNNSISISDFENLEGLMVSGNAKATISKENVLSGERSLKVVTNEGMVDPVITIVEEFKNTLNLNNYKDNGVITGWLNIQNRKDIKSIKVSLSDINGNTREFNVIHNDISSIPNYYDRDDAYPDIPYKNQITASDEWTDFWLNDGLNYFFLRNDPGFYTDTGEVDFGNISKIHFVIEINESVKSKEFTLDDISMISGLQKDDNPLSPNWYPPNGRPQYGVYDIYNDGVKILNVRQSQYLSNGDHGRMLTQGLTPMNFVMRTRINIEDLDKDVNNTWFRLMYDFDSEYDPGHDWFGFFSSYQWNQSGLLTVIPIQRFLLQTQEPLKDDIKLSSDNFSLEEGEYEIQLKVVGQKAEVWIYSTGDECLKLKKHLTYTFERVRDPNKRYPFAIEITGNVKAKVHEVEISEI